MKQKDYRLAAIVFTDINGFSRMMEKDEAGTLEMLHAHNELVRGVVAAHGGKVIKTIGDAFLLDFKNTVDALQSALEIQDKTFQSNKEHASSIPLLLRIGVHLGDIYFFENDALGEGINIASRLQSIAHPGCICISQDVYNLVLNKIDFQAEKLGRVSLKNISKEIHAYEITTPNVEFDPDRGKPRPGYKPGTFAGKDPEMEFIPEADIKPTATDILEASVSPVAREARQAVDGAGRGAEDASGSADLKRILDSVRKSILADIKAHGRRLSVDEVRAKYSGYGPDVETVIADLAAKGILQRGTGQSSAVPSAPPAPRAPAPSASSPGQASGSYVDRFRSIGLQIVDEVARSIETGMDRSRSASSGRGCSPEPRFGDEAPSAPRPAPINQSRVNLSYDFGDSKVKAMNGRWERKLSTTAFSSIKENYIQDFSIYRDSVVAAAKRTRTGLIPNLVSWLAVSAGLFFINAVTSGFSVPWAFLPFFAWGIGIAEHFFAARRKTEKAREIENMPNLNPDQLTLFKRIHLCKDAFTYHGVSTVAVSLFLLAINAFVAFVSRGQATFPWALIPAAAMTFSFISHAAVQGSRVKGLEDIFKKSLGLSGSWKGLFGGKNRQEAPSGPYQEFFAEALSIKEGIIAQLKRGKKRTGPADKDLIPALDEYMGQIRLLASRAGEVDAIVDTIPMAALAEDKAQLLKKESDAQSDRMRREYRKSIEEIEKQESSFQELENQREMLKLRLKSSVNSLKQMRIDVARINTMDDAGDDNAVLMVKQRTSEITQYLDDLRTGLDEEERDPYAELAEAERAKAAALAAASKPEDAEKRLLAARKAELDRLNAEVDMAISTGAAPGPAVEDAEFIPEPEDGDDA
jgi:class 3 adenylate cyclase